MDKIESSFSSFGPDGRSKLVIDKFGTAFITKNGHDFLNNLFPNDTVQRLLYDMVVKSSFRIGDGAMTLCILIFSIIKSKCFNSQFNRSRMLMSLGHITSISHRYESYIINQLIKSQIVSQEAMTKEIVMPIVRNILTPATNDEVSKNIAKLIVSKL